MQIQIQDKLNGKWLLQEFHSRKGKNGLNFISTFSGGGGSSMGWGLAGFKPVAAVELDPKMAKCYSTNIKSKVYNESIKAFYERDLDDYRNIDLLDGSPPCSVFSMAGAREKKWGKEHKFAEGQSRQILDDLFFQWTDLVEKIGPKIAVAENVKGLIGGNAKGYVAEIRDRLASAGYSVQMFLLCASRMGVPQRRERVFIIARRKDLDLPKLELAFNENEITIETAILDVQQNEQPRPDKNDLMFWSSCKNGQQYADIHPKGHLWGKRKLDPNKPAFTLCATGVSVPMHWDAPRQVSSAECCRIQTFPDDYDFCDLPGHYVCGMSVPPFMMQRLGLEIAKQWFGK